jgi:ribosome-binding protein aMBF1 (putative translation factor)
MDAITMNDQIKLKRAKVAEIIQTARVQKGWTQTELGDKVNFSRSTIARIESCTFSPNADQLYIILESLGLTLKIDNEKI